MPLLALRISNGSGPLSRKFTFFMTLQIDDIKSKQISYYLLEKYYLLVSPRLITTLILHKRAQFLASSRIADTGAWLPSRAKLLGHRG